jgi:N-acetylglucosaminyl-diphospho-decaprenol L-rhamnosyltransferase
MTDTAPRTTVITVSYNSMAVLPAMLASVPQDVPVVMVDNSASDDDSALQDLAQGRGATVLRNADNHGFGVACNQGANLAETEFLLFLNPDAQLQPGAIAEMEAAMDRYPQASAMNPRITEADGDPYFKRRSVLLPRKDHMPRGWPEADTEVTVLSGAALFVRRAAFKSVGGFDPQIFLYHEDDDLSLRLRAECGPLMFIRAASVRHIGGSSSVRSAQGAAFKAFHMGQSRVYAMRKHGWHLARARAGLGALGQVILPQNWISRRKIAKQWAFLRGVLSAP